MKVELDDYAPELIAVAPELEDSLEGLFHEAARVMSPAGLKDYMDGAKAMVPWIATSAARQVVLISCDVASAFRDLAMLKATGRWTVTSVTGYDMFPHTGHQEVFAELVRVGSEAASVSPS